MGSVWVETYQTKKGEKHRIRRENSDGSREDIKEKFYYKRKATDKAQKISDTLSEGKPVEETHQISVCHGAFLLQQKALMDKNMISKNYYRILETNLRPFLKKFGDRKDQEISKNELEAWKNQLILDKAPSGVNIVIRTLWKFFKYCKDNGHIRESPAKGVQQFNPEDIKEWRFLDRRELAHLIKSSSNRMKQMRRAIYVLYNTGMRSGEFLQMEWKDLKPTGIMVTNKRRVTRFIPCFVSPPFPKLVRKLMLRFIAHPMNRDTFYSGWATIVENANMGRVRPHDMRHTWASNLKSAGWPDSKIMEMAGWKSRKMLDKYTHVNDNFITKMPRFKIG